MELEGIWASGIPRDSVTESCGLSREERLPNCCGIRSSRNLQIHKRVPGGIQSWVGRGSVTGAGLHLQCSLTCSATCRQLGETLVGWKDQRLWFCGPCGKKSQGFKKVQCDGEK